jgi:hypothetical protein
VTNVHTARTTAAMSATTTTKTTTITRVDGSSTTVTETVATAGDPQPSGTIIVKCALCRHHEQQALHSELQAAQHSCKLIHCTCACMHLNLNRGHCTMHQATCWHAHRAFISVAANLRTLRVSPRSSTPLISIHTSRHTNAQLAVLTSHTTHECSTR